jgi:hypothetical protein
MTSKAHLHPQRWLLIEIKNRYLLNPLLYSRLKLDIEVVDHPSENQSHLSISQVLANTITGTHGELF